MIRGEGKILFIGHGTRLQDGMHMWHRFVDDVAERAGLCEEDVARAFVEIAQPDVTEALVQLAETGVRRVHMVPLLLFSAGHMRVDLPEAVARAEERVGRLQLTWSLPFGDEPAFIDVAVDRARELVARMPEGVGVSWWDGAIATRTRSARLRAWRRTWQAGSARRLSTATWPARVARWKGRSKNCGAWAAGTSPSCRIFGFPGFSRRDFLSG